MRNGGAAPKPPLGAQGAPRPPQVWVWVVLLFLTACGQPGVELVQKGTVPDNPTVTVGTAYKTYGFKEVTWEQYVDQYGATIVMATGEFRMDAPVVLECPKQREGGMVRAGRMFLEVRFVVDLAAKTFVFKNAQYMAYSPKGWNMAYPAGLTAFEAVLSGQPCLDCGVLYAPGP